MSPHNIQVLAQIYAEAARVEGMKTANQVNLLRDEHPPYDEDDFEMAAGRIEDLMREVSHENS